MLRLREATRQEHLQLETDVDIASRLISPERYSDLLTRFYGFYAAFEPLLERAVPSELGLSPEERRKLPTLRRDLRALGIHPDSLPLCPALPQFASAEQAVGAMYVVEGSTLGGQIIARMLRDRLGIDSNSGGAFFAGYGHRNGPMWRSFGTATDAYLARRDGIEAAIEGAKATFLTMHAWLCGSAKM